MFDNFDWKFAILYKKFSNFYHILREDLGKISKIYYNLSRKINGNLQILKILMEILPFYENILEFYPIFRENLVKNLDEHVSGVITIFINYR